MRLTALQLPARHDAFDEQVRTAELLLEQGPATDVVLFNEAAFTGYVSSKSDFDLTRFAEPFDGRAMSTLIHFARRYDCLVVGPLIERDGEQCFNSLLGVVPSGDVMIHYRKHHPWFPETWATPGPKPDTTLLWRGVTLTTAICFDVHVLAAEAQESLTNAEVLLFSSAWVDEGPGLDARPGHLSTLATTFDLAILNANWGEGRPRLFGQGGSLAMGPSGKSGPRLGRGAGRLDVTLDSLRR